MPKSAVATETNRELLNFQLNLSICFVEFVFVCAYLIVWWEEGGQVGFLCQGIIYSFKVAFLHHIKCLQQQKRNMSG